jgi:hypothetical protein
MGFCSLAILTSIVRATLGLRWEEEGDMADILAVIDVDIGQAIQVSIPFFLFLWKTRSNWRNPPRVRKKRLREAMFTTLRQHGKWSTT